MAQRHAYSQPIQTYGPAPHNRNIWPYNSQAAVFCLRFWPILLFVLVSPFYSLLIYIYTHTHTYALHTEIEAHTLLYTLCTHGGDWWLKPDQNADYSFVSLKHHPSIIYTHTHILIYIHKYIHTYINACLHISSVVQCHENRWLSTVFIECDRVCVVCDVLRRLLHAERYSVRDQLPSLW